MTSGRSSFGERKQSRYVQKLPNRLGLSDLPVPVEICNHPPFVSRLSDLDWLCRHSFHVHMPLLDLVGPCRNPCSSSHFLGLESPVCSFQEMIHRLSCCEYR